MRPMIEVIETPARGTSGAQIADIWRSSRRHGIALAIVLLACVIGWTLIVTVGILVIDALALLFEKARPALVERLSGLAG